MKSLASPIASPSRRCSPSPPARAQAQNWKPTRPINLIVPWAAGGSTDQITRVTAAELEKVLGQTIVIVNQPGASGSIGTKSAFDAPRDGYTWTAGAAQDLGTYQTLGSLERQHQGLEPVPHGRQHPGDRRQSDDAVPEPEAAARRDEGQARTRSRSRPRASPRPATTRWS